MKKSAWILLAALLVAGVAAGDVIYLKDGKKIEGKVTKTEDKVILEGSDGRKTEFAPGDVVYIASRTSTPASGPVSTSGPSTGFALVDNPTRPETLAFML